MKLFLILLALVPASLFAVLPNNILAPIESDPQQISGLEFSVVTQSDWVHSGHKSSQETIVLQLRVTNRTDKEILFPTFDSFRFILKGADGKALPATGGRDATRITPNILLQPKASYSLPIKATLQRQNDGKGLAFVIQDGTGSIEMYAVKTGDHLLSLNVFPTHYDFEKEGKLTAPLWKGEGTTKDIKVKVKALEHKK